MKEWFTSRELAEALLPGLPATRQNINRLAEREGWALRPGKSRSSGAGGGLEYHVSLLPSAARSRLAFNAAQTPADNAAKGRSSLLWKRFEALSKEHKAICRTRLELIIGADKRVADGERAKDFLPTLLAEAGISRATYFEWRKMIEGHPRTDWLAALAPNFSPVSNGVIAEFSECHADAWAVFKSDFLRPEKPGFSACYRRMVQLASRKGWTPIPSERTLRRRLAAEVPKAAQIVAREGKRKAEMLFPAQTRFKGHLRAMEITNTDGHQLDLFVRVPWSAKPVRMILIGIQDIYSGKVLSHVISESETWEAVRTCIGAMIENEGGKIPDHLYMDNGRAFASKKISGGAKRRNRFKIDEDEVAGLLVTLGIEPHFTKPYSGRSKPIERAWRDLAEEISKHPAMAGAYTGNNPDAKPENYGNAAVPLEALQAHVAAMIVEHNARTGRRSPVAKGRSFNQVFEESILHPSTIIRTATAEQRHLWLLASEPVTARKPSGAIHYLGNIYWAPELNEWIGKKLTIRFDPHKLHDPVKVYAPSGRFICEAECREAVGFKDGSQARRQAKDTRDIAKHNKAIADIHRRHSPSELADLYGDDALKSPPPIVRPVVTRLVTGNLAHAAPAPDEMSDEEFSSLFRDGLARMMGEDAAIIPFPTGPDRPHGDTPPASKPGRRRAAK